MPFPPRRMPIPPETDGEHGLREKDESPYRCDQKGSAPASIETDVAGRGEPVEQGSGGEYCKQERPRVLDRLVERRERRERDCRPERHECPQGPIEDAAPAEQGRCRAVGLECRPGREGRSE